MVSALEASAFVAPSIPAAACPGAACTCSTPNACRQPARRTRPDPINHPRSEELISALCDAIECVIELDAFHRTFCVSDCCDCPDMHGYRYVLRTMLEAHNCGLFLSEAIEQRIKAHRKWIKDFWDERNWSDEACALGRTLRRQQREMRRRELGLPKKARKPKTPAVHAPALVGAGV